MIEYKRKEEAEEKKERNMRKEKKWSRLYNQKALHVKQFMAVFIFIT
jgi:hypothetical protein